MQRGRHEEAHRRRHERVAAPHTGAAAHHDEPVSATAQSAGHRPNGASRASSEQRAAMPSQRRSGAQATALQPRCAAKRSTSPGRSERGHPQTTTPSSASRSTKRAMVRRWAAAGRRRGGRRGRGGERRRWGGVRRGGGRSRRRRARRAGAPPGATQPLHERLALHASVSPALVARSSRRIVRIGPSAPGRAGSGPPPSAPRRAGRAPTGRGSCRAAGRETRGRASRRPAVRGRAAARRRPS